MTTKVTYEFTNKPWRHNGAGGWVFISLPLNIASEIRGHFKQEEEGWGRLKVLASIGHATWETAIWFDTKMNTYLLPLKSSIRKQEKIVVDQFLTVILWI